MSAKGNCYDNAEVESFFGTLKSELRDPIWDRVWRFGNRYSTIEAVHRINLGKLAIEERDRCLDGGKYFIFPRTGEAIGFLQTHLD